jgi:hypothetical protein
MGVASVAWVNKSVIICPNHPHKRAVKGDNFKPFIQKVIPEIIPQIN